MAHSGANQMSDQDKNIKRQAVPSILRIRRNRGDAQATYTLGSSTPSNLLALLKGALPHIVLDDRTDGIETADGNGNH